LSIETLMDRISPELALVDPELARIARASLPLPGDCLAPRAREAKPRRTLERARHPSVLVMVVALMVAALIGTPDISAEHIVPPAELGTHYILIQGASHHELANRTGTGNPAAPVASP